MATLIVSYPTHAGARFDAAYYTATHIPLVERLWTPHGFTGAEVLFPAGEQPWKASVLLRFSSQAAIDAALWRNAHIDRSSRLCFKTLTSLDSLIVCCVCTVPNCVLSAQHSVWPTGAIAWRASKLSSHIFALLSPSNTGPNNLQ